MPGWHLDRGLALQVDLGGAAHLAHAADAEWTQNFVGPRRRPDCKSTAESGLYPANSAKFCESAMQIRRSVTIGRLAATNLLTLERRLPRSGQPACTCRWQGSLTASRRRADNRTVLVNTAAFSRSYPGPSARISFCGNDVRDIAANAQRSLAAAHDPHRGRLAQCLLCPSERWRQLRRCSAHVQRSPCAGNTPRVRSASQKSSCS
jgi:hypothetical protein